MMDGYCLGYSVQKLTERIILKTKEKSREIFFT